MKPKGEGLVLTFLDFDGCLHHEAVFWKPKIGPHLKAPERYRLFQHVGLLEELLIPFPAVRIVLSTAWIVRYGYSKTLKKLPASLRERCIGATYHSRMPGDGFTDLSRGEQVSNDARRRNPQGWLALDDDVIGWPDATKANLIQTDPYEGISPPEIQAAIKEKLLQLTGR